MMHVPRTGFLLARNTEREYGQNRGPAMWPRLSANASGVRTMEWRAMDVANKVLHVFLKDVQRDGLKNVASTLRVILKLIFLSKNKTI